MKIFYRVVRFIPFFAFLACASLFAADTPRQIIAKAALTDDEAARSGLIASLVGEGDSAIAVLLTAWKEDALFVYTAPDGAKIAVQLTGDKDATDAQEA